MTEKQKYIGAYLDGYFANINITYSVEYFSILEKATKKAKKMWKEYKKTKKL